MPESAGERTEKATPKRRQEARDRGTVAKSQDLILSAGTIALLVTLPSAAAMIGSGALTAFKNSLASMPQRPQVGDLGGLFARSAMPMLGGLVLLLGVAMGVGFVANVGQIGFKITPEALTPNLSKLNPMSGVQRLLSKQGAIDTLKGALKTLFFGYLAYGALRDAWPALMTLGEVAPGVAFSIVGDALHSVGVRVIPAWLVIAGIDYAVQWKRVDDQLKMTKEEVKREAKDASVSPEVLRERNRRARRRKGSMMKAVKEADVIVTNPTHYAVAIKYERGKDAAPVVIAKGVDFLAAKIREEAKAHRVPLVPNPPLARALYKQCEIGDPVPHELFRAVAEVLAYVYRTLRKVQA